MKNKLSNKQLIAALNNGDATSFTYLYKTWYRRLCFFAMKITGSKEDAEDVVVNALTRLYQFREKFQNVTNLEGFLYTAIKNSCIDHIRHLHRQSANEKAYSYLVDYDNEDTIENLKIKSELLNEIYAEVKRLPDNYRHVFELSVLQGLKNEEIAQRLNISLSNVTTRKNRAINLLKLRLSEDGVILFSILVVKGIY
ncbi:RNA polymerase sigma factor [Niastella populi]|nr:RNA polymerase sigma-70 factor [Niastella populi]